MREYPNIEFVPLQQTSLLTNSNCRIYPSKTFDKLHGN